MTMNSYLDSLQSTNIKLGLERILTLCDVLGNPEKKFPSIIVAGTNGKGSTCAFLESILRRNGMKVGLYTSPHLIDVKERIQINRGLISEDDFTKTCKDLESVIKPNQRPTYFEFLTGIAFKYFADQKIDIAVLEVGLGGRFDSTNVLTPVVSVITRIGMDHQKYLGDTIEKIAFEKAGIIKKGVPVVTIDQKQEAMDVIRRVADENESMLHVVSPNEIRWPLGLLGRHQLENAALAFRAAEIVNPAIANIKEALLDTKWPGRLEVVSKDPLVVLDGAHNPNGAESLAKFLKENYKDRRKIIMLGIMSDKDIDGIIKPLISVADEFVLTRPVGERSASCNELNEKLKHWNAETFKPVSAIEPVSLAIKSTLKSMPKDSVLIITGSLYTIGESLAYFRALT